MFIRDDKPGYENLCVQSKLLRRTRNHNTESTELFLVGRNYCRIRAA
jgi:hypothetical protein